MKATNLFLSVLLLALTACSVGPPALAQRSAAPAGPPAVAPTAVAPATALPATVGQSAQPSQAAVFDIGVPAGDAYAPFSAAIDPARNLAYVYHADSAERRPVISVVDLAKGEVARLIRLDRTTPGSSGRLFLTPDGKRLFLQENQDMTVLAIDTGTGSVRKVLEGVRDAALSDDGRVLYAAHEDAVAAYASAELMLGKMEPIWRADGQFVRLALNGQRVLAATYAQEGALVALDAASGKQVAQADVPGTVDALAPGPDGGWAIVVAGENPRLIRYDAALKTRGETPITYTNDLTYDTARNRYLVGGFRYSESEPAGQQVILSVDARDGRLVDEQPWPAAAPPTTFVPSGQDALVAFAAGGPSTLSILDAATLASKSQIPTGVRAENIAIDDQGQRLYVADDLGRIHVLGLPAGEELDVWEGRSPIALDAANGRLYVNRDTGVVALNARTGAVLAQFPQRGHPAPDPKADLVYLADQGVTIYNRSGKLLGTLPSTFPVERGFVPNPFAYAAQVNPVTGHVAVVMNNGIPGSNGGSFLRIYPRQSDKAVVPDAPHSFVMDLTADPQGNWYVAYSTVRNQEAVHVLRPDGQPLRTLDHRTGYLVLEDGKDDLYLFMDGRVTRVEASTLTATDVFEGPDVGEDVAFSPTARAVYAVEYGGPLVTRVDLDTLDPLDMRPVPGRPSSEAYNESIAAVTDGSQRLVLGRFGAIYRTTDGETWERLLPGAEMHYSYVTAVSPRTIFAAGQGPVGGEAVWRSTDGGDTWEFLADGLTDLAPAWPVLANSADEAYFVNRAQGLLRWDPTENKWQATRSASPAGGWNALSLAPDGALFRWNDGYLERSTNRGASWDKLGMTEVTGDVIGYSALYTVTHTLFSVVRSNYRIAGIQRSTDGGKTWQPSITGGPLDFDGYQPEMVSSFGNSYLLLLPYNAKPILLRTTDLGETWKQAPPDAAVGVEHIAVDPVDGRLWLGMKGGVRSLDPERLSWTDLPRSQPAVAASPAPTARQPRGVPASPAPAATPGPGPFPTRTAVPCSESLSGGDAEINARGLGMGCPRGTVQTIPMARQRFQNGQMIWREDRKQIYVLHKDGLWQAYDDRWLETDPVDDPTIVAPSGFQQPGRGFGKVWREELGGPQAALGWALEKEQGVQGQVQDWEFGTVLRFGGEVIVLQDRGTWR